MRELIEQCRRNFGAPPRNFEWWQLGHSAGWWRLRDRAKERLYFFPEPPAWCLKDPLMRIYKDRLKLLQRGRVVWGHLLQANQLLFNPGFGDSPASILYGLDAGWDDQADLLKTIAHEIFALKGGVPEEEQLRPLAHHLTDEMDRKMVMEVPEPICRGRELIAGAIMVNRKHLPAGFLTSGLLPLVINPRETPCAMILPGRYWPAEMLDR